MSRNTSLHREEGKVCQHIFYLKHRKPKTLVYINLEAQTPSLKNENQEQDSSTGSL